MYALFGFRLQRLKDLQVLLVEPKTLGEPDVKVVDILRSNM